MDAEKSMILQNQVRENSEELQSFLRDMDSWEKEMKTKEKELKLINVSENQEVPPIRNSLARKKKNRQGKKSRERHDSEKKEKKSISSYDYKSWDKFDVETELKKVDGEENKEASSSSDCSESSEEKLCAQKQKQLAIIKKDKGNDFFKSGNYDSAINCYTMGMELDPENALLPANRAMAFLKKDQFQAAENDCTLCLSLDSTYVKAYLRRASARESLEQYSLAKSDYLKVLELEPENKQAKQELEKLNKKIPSETIVPPMEIADLQDNSSESPDINMEVEDSFTGTELSDFSEVEEELEPFFPGAIPIPIKLCNREFDKKNFLEIEVTEHSTEKFKELVTKEFTAIEREDGTNSTSEKKLQAKPVSTITTTAPSTVDVCEEIKPLITKLEQALPDVPTASYQFLTDWKKMSKYPDLKYRYLKQFPPENLPVIFKNYMEPEIFPDILKTLRTSFIENGDDVHQYLSNLAAVGRFDTMLMFMSNHERNDLKELVSYLEMFGYAPSEVDEIRKLYKM